MILKTLRLCTCCGVLLAAGLPASPVFAQSHNDAQIRLLEEALEHRQAGDFEQAQAKLETLLEQNPNDPALQALLENVRASQREMEETPRRAPRAQRRAAEPEVEESPLIAEERRRIQVGREEAEAFRQAARRLDRDGSHRDAVRSMERALEILPDSPLTQPIANEMRQELAEMYLRKAQAHLREDNLDAARAALAAYNELTVEETRAARRVQADLDSPARMPIEEVSPGFTEEREQIRHLLRVGRAQLINGDMHGAQQSFREVEAIDSYNAEAKAMLKRIAEIKQQRSHLDRLKTREEMLESVSTAWQLPQVFVQPPTVDVAQDIVTRVDLKLDQIIIPSVNFSEIPLSRAIGTLSAISEEFDDDRRGVNMVVILGEDRRDPTLSINVRELSLRRVLNLMVDQARFRYDIVDDVVEIRPGVRVSRDLEQENFPVSRPIISRMLGRTAQPRAQQVDDPFAPPTAAEPDDSPNGGESEELRRFLTQAAGVDFQIPGASLIYDGTDVWVTQTPRNMERIRNIFRRLSDVRQVEIEAKFLEINESTLNELGFNWSMQSPGGSSLFRSNNRNMAGAFAGQQGTSAVTVSNPELGTQTFPSGAPVLPGVVPLGAGAQNFAEISGVVDGYEIATMIRMLSQRSGTDLLSAPKVTVLSGNQATISVIQEIRYPDTYGDTQSEVGQTGGTGLTGGSAGVTITPGTPQDFQTRGVGVELSVTPTVEQDNSVTLDLNPRVTEFQGFIEYGGLNIAISAGTTVTSPSGYFTPIFATREVSTRVNVWDGATVVMGGLTREEVRKIHDKTPILGDIPGIGRLFRAEGQASEKRNLLVFVTANLVSPGGSPMRQTLRTVEAGSLFQNPTVVTPGGSVSRQRQIVD